MVTPGTTADTPRRVAATLAGAALVLAALLGLGRLARAQLGPQDRYALPFSAVECPAPPGVGAREFLDEVQYLSGMPERLSVLDPALPDRLTEAFGRHPRVEGIDAVRITSPKHVRVELRFRGR